jgi:hypothetical protein
MPKGKAAAWFQPPAAAIPDNFEEYGELNHLPISDISESHFVIWDQIP